MCVCVCALVQAQAWNVARNELKELMKPQKLHGRGLCNLDPKCSGF